MGCAVALVELEQGVGELVSAEHDRRDRLAALVDAEHAVALGFEVAAPRSSTGCR